MDISIIKAIGVIEYLEQELKFEEKVLASFKKDIETDTFDSGLLEKMSIEELREAHTQNIFNQEYEIRKLKSTIQSQIDILYIFHDFKYEKGLEVALNN